MPAADEKRQIAAIGRALEKSAERAVSKIATDVHRELVTGTPKDSGNLAANWIPTTGQPFNSGPRPVGFVGAQTGAAHTAVGLAKLQAYRLTDGPAFVSNRTGYAGDVILDRDPGFVEGAIARAIAAAEALKFR